MTDNEAATLATFILSLIRMYGGITIPKDYLAENQKFDVSWEVEANGDVRIFEKVAPPAVAQPNPRKKPVVKYRKKAKVKK